MMSANSEVYDGLDDTVLLVGRDGNQAIEKLSTGGGMQEVPQVAGTNR